MHKASRGEPFATAPKGAMGGGDASSLKTFTLSLLERVLPASRSFAVRLWDETTLPATSGPPRATLVLKGSDTLGRMLTPPLDLAVGEAYLRGDFEVEGNMEAVFEAAEALRLHHFPLDWASAAQEAATLRKHAHPRPVALATRLHGRRHSRTRDRQAIRHHYDVSNAFYKLWLDGRMVYSCAYFPEGTETLDAAQEAKLELICRKLRLKRGERLLDIGSGWGGLVIYAAQRYGAHALGITLSERQVEEARARVRAAGLEDRVRIEGLDYRDLEGTFDKIASVGMAEHVGREKLDTYFRTAWDRLKPGGLMLNHAISRGPRTLQSLDGLVSGEFTQRYVFPDGEILPLWESLQTAETQGFEVRDVEDLREHYALTLRRWVKNLEASWVEAVREAGPERARLWRLFLSASAYQFACGYLSVHQALLAKPDARGRVALPPSRADLYRQSI